MDYISEKDYYETRPASLISDIDREVLSELYQPLIGHKSVGIFLSLFHEKMKASEIDTFDHAHLFDKMQMSAGEFFTARRALEAVGLLRTFFKEEGGIRYYIYVLYAPKSPREFFDDVLFKGLLIKCVGEKEAKRLALSYKVDFQTKGFDDITSSFVETFHPDYDSPVFRKDLKVEVKGRKSGRIDTSFDFDDFFSALDKNGQIKREVLTKKDLKEIERLAALFSLDELTMAEIVVDAYDPDNKAQRINFQRVSDRAKEEVKFPFFHRKSKGEKSHVTSDSELASKIKLMDAMAPGEYLRIKQNNTAPSRSDLDIVDDLSKNFGFSHGVINALIDYVLAKNKNVLSRRYIEKIASSLARESVTTAIDTMNYLIKINSAWKTSKPSVIKTTGGDDKIKEEEISDEELESILALLEAKKD
ncbi:MAG TPA: DnaD domain protein [Bacilli bacterium]|jgi:replication initiation and membrane attachment protein|nr:DnaD domain protein [Bacilli bacterium]